MNIGPATGITTIIPYWGGREEALVAVLNGARWNTMVMVPEGLSLSHPNPFVSVRQVYGIKGWPISDLLNAGAEVSGHNLLNFRGADVPFGEFEKELVMLHARANPCFAGFSHRLDIRLCDPDKEPLAIDIAQKYHGVGVSFYIRREVYDLVGPWVKYDGYGHEDLDYAYRCRAMLGYYPHERALPMPVYHYHHAQGPCDHLDANRAKLEEMMRNTPIKPRKIECS